MTQQDPNPHEALAAIRDARSAVGRDMKYPVTWDIGYGAVCASIVGSQGLSQPWGILLLGVSLCALALMVRWWRDKMGWWVNGYGPKRARWVAFGLAAALIGLIGVSLWAKYNDGLWWIPAISAALAFAASIIAGRLWMRAYRRDLKAEVE